MRKNIKKFKNLLKLDNYEYFKFSIIFILLVYFDISYLTVVVGIVISLWKRKIIYLILILLLLFSYSDNKIKVVDVKENYSVIKIKDETYFSREKNFSFDDEVFSDYEVKYLEESDFNEFLIRKGITKEIIFDKKLQIKSVNSLKSLLFRYIKRNVDKKNQSFVFSVFFNYKFRSFTFFSLHYPALFIIVYLKKRNKYLGLIMCLVLLMLDFKLILITQLVSILFKDKLNNHDLFGIQCIVSAILLKMSLFSVSFYFFLAFKIIQLFYAKYKLNNIVVYLLSIYFFHQIPVLNLLLFKYIKWFLFINFIITVILLPFSYYLNQYVNLISILLNQIPYFSWNHSISTFIFVVVILLIITIRSKKRKIILYVLLLYPNSWKLYQEIIFIPTYNDFIIIQKPNFFQKPIIHSKMEIPYYILNQYGINYYEKTSLNTKNIDNNYLIYFNDLFYVGNYYFEQYRNLNVDYYLTKQINDDIILNNIVKYTVLFDSNDVYSKDEQYLISMKKPYFTTNKSVKIIYFLNQKMIIK